jgi:hypothetical protein
MFHLVLLCGAGPSLIDEMHVLLSPCELFEANFLAVSVCQSWTRFAEPQARIHDVKHLHAPNHCHCPSITAFCISYSRTQDLPRPNKQCLKLKDVMPMYQLKIITITLHV